MDDRGKRSLPTPVSPHKSTLASVASADLDHPLDALDRRRLADHHWSTSARLTWPTAGGGGMLVPLDAGQEGETFSLRNGLVRKSRPPASPLPRPLDASVCGHHDHGTLDCGPCLIRFKVSSPSIPGIFRSVRPPRSVPGPAGRASSPSPAETTSWPWVAMSSARVTRLIFSSSVDDEDAHFYFTRIAFPLSALRFPFPPRPPGSESP